MNSFREVSVCQFTFHIKIAVVWDVAPCSLVDIDHHFRGAYCLPHQALSCSETSVNICQTTGHNIHIPGDSNLYTRRENLKSHLRAIDLKRLNRFL
jgi:hypothetical protein